MKLVILDRDGVINYDSEAYIKSPDEWLPIPGSLEAIVRLKKAGYHVAVATNQSGIARGYYNYETLANIHQKMQDALFALGAKIDTIVFCPHAPSDNCECRKPKPGLLLKIAQELQVDLRGVPFVGDAMRDIVAAKSVGCLPVLVRTNPHLELDPASLVGVSVYQDLAEAVNVLLSSNQ